MTTPPSSKTPLLTEQLQKFRHELSSARADVQAGTLPPPAFQASATQWLEAIAQGGLRASEASRALRLLLLSKTLDAWTLDDLDQILARLDEALVELVKPG